MFKIKIITQCLKYIYILFKIYIIKWNCKASPLSSMGLDSSMK